MTDQTTAQMREHIGRRVTVLLDREENVTLTGRLLEVHDDGVVRVEHDDGQREWAWPSLHITETPS